MLGKKGIISGPSCTGKTTLGRQIADTLNRRQVDLDDLHFLPNWVSKDPSVFVADVSNAVDQHEAWIVSGGYNSKLKDTLWQKADTIIWLDLSLMVILRRYFKRTYQRIVYKERCCGDNYETLKHVMFDDVMLYHILKSYNRRKARLKDWRYGCFADKTWIVPTSPKEVQAFLQAVDGQVTQCA